jgi:hypothetical protein
MFRDVSIFTPVNAGQNSRLWFKGVGDAGPVSTSSVHILGNSKFHRGFISVLCYFPRCLRSWPLQGHSPDFGQLLRSAAAAECVWDTDTTLLGN